MWAVPFGIPSSLGARGIAAKKRKTLTEGQSRIHTTGGKAVFADAKCLRGKQKFSLPLRNS